VRIFVFTLKRHLLFQYTNVVPGLKHEIFFILFYILNAHYFTRETVTLTTKSIITDTIKIYVLYSSLSHYLSTVLQCQDIVFGIGTRYGSDDPELGRSGFRTPVGRRFSVPTQTGPGAHSASYRMDTKSLSRW